MLNVLTVLKFSFLLFLCQINLYTVDTSKKQNALHTEQIIHIKLKILLIVCIYTNSENVLNPAIFNYNLCKPKVTHTYYNQKLSKYFPFLKQAVKCTESFLKHLENRRKMMERLLKYAKIKISVDEGILSFKKSIQKDPNISQLSFPEVNQLKIQT